MNIIFKEFSPQPVLAPFVQSFWIGDFNINRQDGFTQRVVPNGCVELIIHLEDDHCSLFTDENRWKETPNYLVIGTYQRPYDVQFSTPVKVFGIRFFPDGIKQILGVYPSEFINAYENGIDVLGGSIEAFCDSLRSIPFVNERVALANNFLSKQLERNFQNHDFTHLAMRSIREEMGVVNHKKVLNTVPLSQRQLQRAFKKIYGITISDYMRLARVNAIHNYLLSGVMDLTRISYSLHFADQAHLSKEFKNYTGMSPKTFAKQSSQFIVNTAF
ncbi:helix-turn-helix transcriptional regulator [Ekhidna sp. MALMAid0563]|uniref:helix-turn-helix transcriptional regulator n=1 Tax=Ekhidna sp. MALMAid0563 TaxID=3143937 RepID=UPI0032DF9885